MKCVSLANKRGKVVCAEYRVIDKISPSYKYSLYLQHGTDLDLYLHRVVTSLKIYSFIRPIIVMGYTYI